MDALPVHDGGGGHVVPAVDHGVVYFGSMDGNLYACSRAPADGALW